MIASSFQTIASVSALKVRLYSRARALFSNLLFCDYRATTTRDGRQRLRRRCRQQKTERERDEWDNFVYLSPSLSLKYWEESYMMRRKKTHSLSYFRGEKKHSRKKRFDPYLPLYLKAIVRSSSREVPLEGRSESETEDDEFYFLATPSSLLPFLRRYGKKGERWLFF